MEALSKAKLKLFTSLQRKKYRKQHNLFLAEGKKLVWEALEHNAPVQAVIIRDDLKDSFNVPKGCELYTVSEAEFGKLSTQVQSEGILAVIEIPETGPADRVKFEAPSLLLWNLQDPGNLGTIIRTADWFGIPTVYCSTGTVDCYNPKVIRAAMGAVFRVHIHYLEDMEGFIREHSGDILAADLSGTEIAHIRPAAGQAILIGNEANGLPAGILGIPGLRAVRIPGTGHSESLNAAVSAGILTHWLVSRS